MKQFMMIFVVMFLLTLCKNGFARLLPPEFLLKKNLKQQNTDLKRIWINTVIHPFDGNAYQPPGYQVISLFRYPDSFLEVKFHNPEGDPMGGVKRSFVEDKASLPIPNWVLYEANPKMLPKSLTSLPVELAHDKKNIYWVIFKKKDKQRVFEIWVKKDRIKGKETKEKFKVKKISYPRWNIHIEFGPYQSHKGFSFPKYFIFKKDHEPVFRVKTNKVIVNPKLKKLDFSSNKPNPPSAELFDLYLRYFH